MLFPVPERTLDFRPIYYREEKMPFTLKILATFCLILSSSFAAEREDLEGPELTIRQNGEPFAPLLPLRRGVCFVYPCKEAIGAKHTGCR